MLSCVRSPLFGGCRSTEPMGQVVQPRSKPHVDLHRWCAVGVAGHLLPFRVRLAQWCFELVRTWDLQLFLCRTSLLKDLPTGRSSKFISTCLAILVGISTSTSAAIGAPMQRKRRK